MTKTATTTGTSYQPSPAEWTRIAKALRAAYPERALEQAARADDLPLTLAEIRRAARRVLPEGHANGLKQLPRLRATLLPLLQVVKLAAPAATASKVFWDDSHWRKVAEAMLTLYPEANFLSSESMLQLKAAQVQQAMRHALPPHEHRKLLAMTTVRTRLRREFDLIAASRQPARPAPVAVPAPIPVEVVSTAGMYSINGSALIYRQPDGIDNGAPGAKKIFWKDEHVDKVVMEIMFQNPTAPYLESVATLSSADVFAAQRVLPTNVRRSRISLAPSQSRPLLAPAFARLRAALVEETAQRRKQAELARLQSVAAAAERAEAERAAEIERARQAGRHEALQEAAAQQRALAAATPGALVDALLAQLGGAVGGVLKTALVAALSDDSVKKALTVHVHTHGHGHGGVAAASAPAADNHSKRLPRVVIAGHLKANHVREIKEDFGARYDLRFHDPDEPPQVLKERARQAYKVILMTDLVNHKCRNALDAEKVEYLSLAGSIGRLRDTLSQLPLPN